LKNLITDMGFVRAIIKNPLYTTLALFIAVAIFTFAVWLPNWRLVIQMFLSSDIALSDRLSLLGSLYGSIGTNFTLLSASYTIAIALLFGVNIVLLMYYVDTRKEMKNSGRGMALGAGGLTSGFFGIGCAACGTFILSSFLGFVGAAGIITFLPLGGGEFGLLGVAILGYSVYAVLRKIKEPFVCKETFEDF